MKELDVELLDGLRPTVADAPSELKPAADFSNCLRRPRGFDRVLITSASKYSKRNQSWVLTA